MEIEIVTLCLSANFENNGGLSLIKTFDTFKINAQTASIPPCVLAVRIRVASMCSETFLLFNVRNSAGDCLVTFRHRLMAENSQKNQNSQCFTLVDRVVGLPPVVGDYKIEIAEGKHCLFSAPFYIVGEEVVNERNFRMN